MDEGTSWRRHCWQAARSALLPVLPIEVLRTRVARARALGLEYKTYASIRATSGHDVIAFLFSSNALRLLPPAQALREPERARLAAIAGAARIGLARAPLSPEGLAELAAPLLEAVHPAPAPWARWADARAALKAAHSGWPRDGVVLVGAGPDEPAWAEAARLAAFLPSERFFAA